MRKIKKLDINKEVVLIDDEDYFYIVAFYDLKVNDHGYVYCSPKKKYKRMGLYSTTLHKLLMNPDKKGRNVVVDHRDGNKLNNQKDNLRVCSHQQNMQNRKTQKSYAEKDKISIYKGVYYDRGWRAQMGKDAGKFYIGSYDTEITAANAYNHKAKELFGEFAQLNDVPFMALDEVISRSSANKKTSQYRGVSFVEGRWITQIYHNGKNKIVGKYQEEIQAAMEYDKAAYELKGNKAKLNFS